MQVPETEVIVTGPNGAELLRTILIPGDYVLGRDPGCELRVEADLVSRRHAQLTVNFDHALIEDLGSSNGTSVNGQPITECTRLWPNQVPYTPRNSISRSSTELYTQTWPKS